MDGRKGARPGTEGKGRGEEMRLFPLRRAASERKSNGGTSKSDYGSINPVPSFVMTLHVRKEEEGGGSRV